MRNLGLRENVPLAPLTMLRIGGDARYFVRAETEDQVAEAVQFAKTKSLKFFVLGGGSNILVADAGFDGLVLQIGIRSSEFRVRGSESESFLNAERGTRNSELISAGAGEDWDGFVDYCVENNLAGVECLSGIPGFVGGTPVQNVGAYGQEVAETIVSVRCFDRESVEFVTLSNAECGFAYRTSIFNTTTRDRYIVLSVVFALNRGGEPKVVYKDLIEHFGGRRPSLSETREAVLKIRRAKSMVIESGDPNARSVGSFFKNPIVERSKLEEIRGIFAESVPFFEFGKKVKIPAAWLIEKAGFHKGYALGNAGISTNHTLALINRGNARATEIIALKEKIQDAVAAKFAVELVPEPVFVGFS